MHYHDDKQGLGMRRCHYVRGFNGERVLIPECWAALMDGRSACTCERGKSTMECLEERIEKLEKALEQNNQTGRTDAPRFN